MPTQFTRRGALAAATGIAASAACARPSAVARPATPLPESESGSGSERAAPGERFRALRAGTPEQAGMDAATLRGVDDAVLAGLGPDPESTFPGAAVLIARDGIVVRHRAYGSAQTYVDRRRLRVPRPMHTGTIFDLASVTKVTATTAAVMRLVDLRRIRLDDAVSRWLPAFGSGGKAAITVRHLLTHTSGLWEWQPVYLHATEPRAAIRYICGLPLRYPVGADRHYSDLNFMLLGEIVRRETGTTLPAFVREQVHGPLGMTATGFTPAGRYPADRFAATSLGDAYERNMVISGEPYPILGGAGVDDFTGWRGHTLLGEVNDGNSAHAYRGVAGHAGLFGTARDVAVYCQMLANGGGYGNRRVLSEAVVGEFTRERLPGQALGFWTDRFADVPSLRTGGFGHSGFTGTEFTVDPERGLVVVMLTNRCHPNLPFDSVSSVWTGICDAVGRSLR
jgi:CubicO group peptidase (beta-lactamase class C family)